MCLELEFIFDMHDMYKNLKSSSAFYTWFEHCLIFFVLQLIVILFIDKLLLVIIRNSSQCLLVFIVLKSNIIVGHSK
jgi:hypothetical protein